jgi:acrylyl-CoA reductase (NADPH)
VGLAGGAAMEGATVIPFILRGVSLLGIDSVMKPRESRIAAWSRIVADLPLDLLEAMVSEHPLAEVPDLAGKILQGGVRGRAVIDMAR